MMCEFMQDERWEENVAKIFLLSVSLWETMEFIFQDFGSDFLMNTD